MEILEKVKDLEEEFSNILFDEEFEASSNCIIPKGIKDLVEIHKIFPNLKFGIYRISDYVTVPVTKVTKENLAVLNTLNIKYRKL
jgi:hypothetical protein